MTGKQRMLAVLANGEADRPPYSFWKHLPAEQTGITQSIRAHVDYARESGCDAIKLMNDGYRAPVDLSAERASDWFSLRPRGLENPYIREQLERAKGIVDAIGSDTFIYGSVFAPMALLRRAGDGRLSSQVQQAFRNSMGESQPRHFLGRLLMRERTESSSS